MPDSVLKMILDNSSVIEGLTENVELLQKIQMEAENGSAVTQEAFDAALEAIKQNSEQLEKNRKKASDSAKEATRLKRVNDALEGGYKKLTKSISVFGVDLDQVIGFLRTKQKATTTTTKNVSGLSRVFGVFGKVLKGLGIGLIITLLTSLSQLLQRNQKAIDAVNRIFGGFSAIVDVVADRLANFQGVLTGIGNFFGKIFRGQFRAAFSDLRNEVKSVVDEAVFEFNRAQELIRKTQELRDRSIELDLKRSAANKDLRELNLLIEDITASERDRTEAAIRFNDIETNLVKEQIQLQKEKLATLFAETEVTERVNELLDQAAQGVLTVDDLLGELGISNSTIKDVEEFRDEFLKLNELQERSFEVQVTNNNKLNAIRESARAAAKAQREEVERLNKEYQDLLKTINARVQQAELESLEGEERLQREKEIALEELRLLEEKARAAAQAARQEFVAEEQFAALRLAVEERTQEKISQLRIDNAKKVISEEEKRLLAQTELLSFSADAELNLEEFKAQERIRIQREALLKQREILAQEFGEESVQVLELDVQVRNLEAQDVANIEANLKRIRDEQLKAIQQEEALALKEVELLQVGSSEILTLEQEKQQQRLLIQLQALEKRREIVAEATGIDSFETREIDLTIQRLQQQIDAFDQIKLDPIQRFKQQFLEALRINEDDFAFLQEQTTAIFASIAEGVDANRERQLEENQQLIDSIEDRIEKTQELLEQELEDRENGLANNVEAVKKQLLEEQAERAKALQEREELEKKATQARIRRAIFEQGQNVLTGVSRVIAAESGKGILALITIGAAIAGIFAAMAKARAEVAKTKVPEFRTGGPLLQGLVIGPSHESRGVNVTDGRQLFNIEGGEYVNRKSVTDQFGTFLKGLNEGDSFAESLASLYQGGLAPSTHDVPGPSAANVKEASERQAIKDGTKEGLQELLGAFVDGNNILQKILEKPDYVSQPDGYIKISEDGNKRKRVHLES